MDKDIRLAEQAGYIIVFAKENHIVLQSVSHALLLQLPPHIAISCDPANPVISDLFQNGQRIEQHMDPFTYTNLAGQKMTFYRSVGVRSCRRYIFLKGCNVQSVLKYRDPVVGHPQSVMSIFLDQ